VTPASDSESITIPLDQSAIVYASATGSIQPARIGPLLRQAQAYLCQLYDEYQRQYECTIETDGRAIFLVPAGHWTTLADEIGCSSRAIDAIARAHAEQLRRLGRQTDRRDEFETALEIRDAIVIGTDTLDNNP
jgi:hypothetical protein